MVNKEHEKVVDSVFWQDFRLAVDVVVCKFGLEHLDALVSYVFVDAFGEG